MKARPGNDLILNLLILSQLLIFALATYIPYLLWQYTYNLSSYGAYTVCRSIRSYCTVHIMSILMVYACKYVYKILQLYICAYDKLMFSRFIVHLFVWVSKHLPPSSFIAGNVFFKDHYMIIDCTNTDNFCEWLFHAKNAKPQKIFEITTVWRCCLAFELFFMYRLKCIFLEITAWWLRFESRFKMSNWLETLNRQCSIRHRQSRAKNYNTVCSPCCLLFGTGI